MTHEPGIHPPQWVRVVDGVILALAILTSLVAITGGFRARFFVGQISVTSATRLLVILAVVLGARHYFYRAPSTLARYGSAFAGWIRSAEGSAVLPIFAATRLGVLAVGLFGVVLFGYPQGTAPERLYADELANLPVRWDVGWYLSIASDGYRWDPAAGGAQQNIAFFPAYPLLMRYTAPLFGNQLVWAGVAISLISFFVALRYLFRLSRLWLDERDAAVVVTLLCVYPFAVYFSAPYTEALFLLTIVAAFYHFEKNALVVAGLWGLLAGLTRPNGCLLSVPLALLAVRDVRQRRPHDVAVRMLSAAMPAAGMLGYSAYIYALTGNPFQWAASNAAWGRRFRNPFALFWDDVEYLGTHGFSEYIKWQSVDALQVVAAFLTLAAVIPIYRRLGLAYAAFVAITVALPLSIGGFLSMGRVTSVLFPMFIWLGSAIGPDVRMSVIAVSAMLQALCALGFFTWRSPY